MLAKATNKILSLSSQKRLLILIVIDIFIIILSNNLALYFTSKEYFNKSDFSSLIITISTIFIGLTCYLVSGQYIGLTRYTGSRDLNHLIIRNLVISIISRLTLIFLQFEVPPLRYFILLWILLSSLSVYIRFFIRDFILKIKISKNKNKKKVIIYGAGDAGAQLASSLIQDGRYSVEGFIDDDSHLWRRNIKGIPIYPPSKIYSINNHIDQVLLAIPSLRKKRRLEILHTLYKKGVPVFQIPSIDEIKSKKNLITLLKPVNVEDILGREPIDPNNSLLKIAVNGKIVCITGAGGSIGSELCKQIYNLKPYKMILIDHSESNLYNINKQINAYPDNGIEVKAILGSTTDLPFINKVFTSNKVSIVFHTAAYKHVPLVESNPLKGLSNNVFSTETVCKAALEAGATHLVMVSTDKAVRPTNVMGASKRLSELVVQAIAEKSKENSIIKNTCFSMVRFGNVLGSSGSVLPLFQEQINNGGPITLTHPNIIRYFMTISEAAQLVIQSKVLAEGGDVFLLEMGKPVSIKSLAEQLILLNGLSIKDSKNLEGDIEIKCTGLRPGEKLYEELIIDGESKKTIHPLIYRADESFIPFDILMPKLESLKSSLDNEDEINSLLILKELVPEWDTDLI